MTLTPVQIERLRKFIHNTFNTINVPKYMHKRFSAHYSTKYPLGGTIRDNQNSRSLIQRHKYGLERARFETQDEINYIDNLLNK